MTLLGYQRRERPGAANSRLVGPLPAAATQFRGLPGTAPSIALGHGSSVTARRVKGRCRGRETRVRSGLPALSHPAATIFGPMQPAKEKSAGTTPAPDEDDRTRLRAAIDGGSNILLLATELLALCRDQLEALITADGDVSTWRRRDALRREAEALFELVNDEEIDADERAALHDLAADCADLPAVAVARTIAEALDAALGHRFLAMFLGRAVTLREGDPIPTPHPDWRTLTPQPNSDPWALDGRLDALPHLRLASDWARQLRVTIDGDWRTWHAVPQLGPGDRVACALPNAGFDELEFRRKTVEGRAMFYDLHPRLGDDEQTARCIALLERAAEQGCRLVVFPELSVPRGVVDELSRWLDRQQTVELIVAGSHHRKAKNGRWHNESQILFRGWRRRRRHRKFRPFSFIDTEGQTRVTRTEDLAQTSPRMRVYLSTSWTLSLLICKDAVVEPVPRALVNLRANLVLVPALSFKLDAFRTAVADVATWSQGIALVANAGFGPTARAPRPGVVVGLPSQSVSVHQASPPPLSLLVITIGNPKKNPSLEVVLAGPPEGASIS